LRKLLRVNPEDEVDMKYWNLALGRDVTLGSGHEDKEESIIDEGYEKLDLSHNQASLPSVYAR
jgi:hypothetical protein